MNTPESFSAFNGDAHPEQDGSPAQRTILLRAAADGETTREQEVELRAHLRGAPGDVGVIEFERRMREAIGMIARGPAPGALRERIFALRGASSHRRPAADRDAVRHAARKAPASRRVSGMRVRASALAAVCAVMLIGAIAALRIGAAAPRGTIATESHRVELVNFIAEQAEECELHADLIGTRFRVTDPGEVPAEFARVLGSSPDLGRVLSSGLRLLGAGACSVPGRGKSVRMVLEGASGTSLPARVTLYVQQDTGELGFGPGKTYCLNDGRGERAAGGAIWVWRRDGFVYFLSSRSGPAMRGVGDLLGVAEPVD